MVRVGRRVFASRLCVVTLALIALTATACSSSSTKTTPSAASTKPAAQGVLGTPNKATGSPVTFGFMWDGKTQSVDTTGDMKAANAAAGLYPRRPTHRIS